MSLIEIKETDVMEKFQTFCARNEFLGSEQKVFFGIFLRKEFTALCLTNANFSELINHIELAFKLSENDKIDNNVPFLLIEDFVEVGSYSALEHLLPYIDEKSITWIEKLSSKKGSGLILLRTVNLLRRKIARSEHSKLAGLSLLLLAKIFPASERSGVNLRGERNVDNKNLKSMIETEGNSEEYSQFIFLHKMFYNTSTKFCYDENWTCLRQAVEGILKRIEKSVNNISANRLNIHETSFSLHHLFTEKSFELQIDDNCFRITLLAQILFFLQDINSSRNEVGIEAKVNEVDLDLWITEATKKTFYLISLHSSGKEYFRFLRAIFRNEKNWISWKVDSCPSFEKNKLNIFQDSQPQMHSNSIHSTVQRNMGDDELHRLWNYPLEGVENRRLKPELEDFQTDAHGEAETNDSNTFWRSNRLKWKLNF